MVNPSRIRLVSALLSALAPGAGQVYAGRLVPGVAFAVGNVVIATLGALIIAAGSRSCHPVVLAGGCSLALWMGSVVDSLRGAPVAPSPEFRRWYVCLLLAALSLTGAANWALSVRRNVVEVFHVPSASMLPSISPGTRVFVNKAVYEGAPVRRGEVVVFINPNERHQRYVKRVVALPGDTVDVVGTDVFINGTKLDHSPVPGGSGGPYARLESNGEARYPVLVEPGADASQTPRTPGPVKVPNGHCFVLGDNRTHSTDSRDVGPIPLADILGRVDWTW